MTDQARPPAPAPRSSPSDAQCLAAMREFSAQKGESHDAMWDQCDEAERQMLVSEWRAILECAQLVCPHPSAGDALEVRAWAVVDSAGNIVGMRRTKQEADDFANDFHDRVEPLYLRSLRPEPRPS